MRSGDPCPKCVHGRLVVYATKRVALAGKDLVKGYLKCSTCNATAGTQIVPRRLSLAERRKLIPQSSTSTMQSSTP
jgi:hypothetical protein